MTRLRREGGRGAPPRGPGEATPPGTGRGAVASEAAGWALLAGGAALMVLPGPGIPLVLAGLVLVGRRRPWARRLHARVRTQARVALDRVRSARARRT